MANHLVAYSDDESSSESTGSRSMLTSPNAQSQGEENHSTDTSITSLPHDSIPTDPVPVCPQSPLPTYASGEPFTPSPSSPLSETPTPNRHFSPPLSPIEPLFPLPPPLLLRHYPLTHSNKILMMFPLVTNCKRVRSQGLNAIVWLILLEPIPSRKRQNMKKFLEMGKEKYFRTKPVLRGRTFHPDILSIDVVLEENVVTSTVKGVELVFYRIRLGEILRIPSIRLAEYVWATNEQCILTTKYSQGRVTSKARKVLKGEMAPVHKLLFELVHKGVLPRGHRRHISSFRDMGISNALESKEPIDWPSLMIKHMARVADPQPGSHRLAFGNLLTRVFTAFAVPLGEGLALTCADMFTQSTLAECGLIIEPAQVLIASPRASGPVTRLLKDLQAARDQCETLQNENMSLRTELTVSKEEVGRLKDQLVQQQLDNNARVDRVLQLLASSSSCPPNLSHSSS
ncbi:hypothetical protein KY290_033569 [Solanum tuberosum]|uniref:Integrase core domain containing protein n=1 Tax=Solanum tuberosum TaxID=4113 RepID=A0ABQ7U135_SOLTU|nr:hypothetical protein KY289_032939 [Solanum tuberosum]KAH0644639.1 hypothetical protein KY284_032523 [Solanum tuberosum]KAH0647579.1 hypothetical protein KY285_032827 [Solanum tuberosum]KAH0740526.1 hypothetical protein KY290_033569 [Solanum tuberosum]